MEKMELEEQMETISGSDLQELENLQQKIQEQEKVECR